MPAIKDVINSEDFKKLSPEAKKIVFEEKNINLKINVKSPSQLKDFGGLLAVGNSSPKNGPYFVEVTYRPKSSRNVPHVVLVGKGIDGQAACGRLGRDVLSCPSHPNAGCHVHRTAF